MNNRNKVYCPHCERRVMKIGSNKSSGESLQEGAEIEYRCPKCQKIWWLDDSGNLRRDWLRDPHEVRSRLLKIGFENIEAFNPPRPWMSG